MENYFQITNDFKLSENKGQCNPFNNHNNFGNYFKTCPQGNKSAYWGSDKPTADKCLQPQVGQPCHALWNNLTKRKSIVDYRR
tara:strand:- start:185 stop:433 length:249 start_codon:yes stop_codon:yes gene_type:complete